MTCGTVHRTDRCNGPDKPAIILGHIPECPAGPSVSSDMALRPETGLIEGKISKFARLMRENMDSTIPFRRAYLRAVMDQVEVDDGEVRIHELDLMHPSRPSAAPRPASAARAGRTKVAIKLPMRLRICHSRGCSATILSQGRQGGRGDVTPRVTEALKVGAGRLGHVAPRAQEGRDALCASEAHPET